MKVPIGHPLASFTRAVLTIDPDGMNVNSNVPRFDESVRIAAVPAPDAVTGGFERVYAPGGYLLASGVDHDGTTPLMVYLNVDNGKLLVFYANTITPQAPKYTTFGTGEVHEKLLEVRIADSASHLAGNGRTFNDLLDNTPAPGAKALEPRTAVICHGAIFVGGPVWVHTGGPLDKYDLKGWGFAINQTQGSPTGWSLVWDDTLQSQGQLYLPRGLYWCMRAAPIWQRGVSYPTAFAISSSDYIFKDQPGGQAASGRAFYFRITRQPLPAPSNWVVGQGTQNTVKAFDIRPPVYRLLNHVHSCIATEWNALDAESPGVQLVASIGDNMVHNRFIRFTMADHTADYTITTPDPWTIQENYHAKADAQGGPAEATQSMQPATGFFAPTAGDIIWTADLQTEWISLMRLPTGGASPDQARFQHLYGWATGYGHDALNPNVPRSRPVFFGLSQPRPEVIGHRLAAVYDEEASLSGATPEARRVLFCPDSTKPREWVQVAATPNVKASPTVAIHESPTQGNYLYFASFGGIERMPIPSATANTLLSIRPMLVAPGGQNMVRSGDYHVQPVDANPFARFSKSGGQWVDPADATRILPNPPSMATRAIQVRTKIGDNTSHAGNVRVSGAQGGWNLAGGPAWTEGTQVRRLRGWVLDNSYNRSGLTAPLLPNKTNQTLVRLWDEQGALSGGNGINYSCDDRWCPVTIISPEGLVQGTGLGLRISGDGRGNDNFKDENYGFFIADLALDGNGSLPYPMTPETNGPDEKLTIGGLTLTTEQSWSIKVAGMVPVANWDHHAGRETFNGSGVSARRWPLFSLWADNDNWIEFSANCETKGFRLRVKANGTILDPIDFGEGRQIWLPDSPVIIGVAHAYTAGAPASRLLYVGASLGGDLVKVGPNGIVVPWSGKTISELRFRGAPSASIPDGEVCEFRWIGGEINPTTALTNTSLPSAFTDLAFLSGP